MHPALAQLLAMQQAQPPRPFTAEEQALVENIIELEGHLILFERMSAVLDRNHGTSVRNDLSSQEIAAFTDQWSEEVLDLCLRAGVTSWEMRRALRTGNLPDHGMVGVLAAFRTQPEQP